MANQNDSFTKVLLPLNGTDGSTIIADTNVGGSAHTWTANGNAQIDTAISKFGGAALLLDGSGDYLSTPDHADFDVGSGAFTIDFWFNRAGGDGTIREAWGGQASRAFAGRTIEIALGSANVWTATVFQNDSTFATVTGTTTFTATGWHHIAFIRTGNTLRLFVNGTQEGGDVAFGASVQSSGNN